MDRRTSSKHQEQLERSQRKWDFWSARESLWGFYERDTREFRRAAVSQLHLEQGDVALDIGCGPGTNFELLREAVGSEGRVVGVDLSPGMIERATERIETHGWENVETIRADATALPLGTDRFDGALATTAVSSTPDVRATVENAYGALKPGARFAVHEIRLVPSGLGRVLNPLIERFYRVFGNWNDEEDVFTELERAFDGATVVEAFALGTNYIAVANKADEGK
ncbi:class I SAM-dependent methyltransferase [Haladaptatus salinisoli]|uniref:class I SAM-dependent methyltransferase n=1 Tax=Haladaptatus salinisoli TaxID=2884876 RepID=UPI001D099F90|nr:methyltransferase domain-containing protein [Haladaptatus salinisoli]